MNAFSDDSRFWVIFDTCTKLHYYPDLHKLLAAPNGYVIRYEYRRKWLSDEAAATLDKRSALPSLVLLAYAQSVSYIRGQEAPDSDSTGAFDERLWIPTRLARLVNVVQAGDEYYFDLDLTGYPVHAANEIFLDLFERKETPYWKWVAFSLRHGDLAALTTGTDDDKWRRIVERLFVAPSQFAGDAFWRINGLKEAGQPQYLDLAQYQEIGNKGLRQVTAGYELVEDRVYSAEITTLRSPQARPGTSSGRIEVVVKSSDDKTAQLVGSGRSDVRQYTGIHVEFETRHLEFLGARKLELSLDTEPKDGQWPQGPQIALKLKVGKNWVKVALGMIAGLSGLGLGASAVAELFKGHPGALPIVAGVGGVLLVAIGLTVLSGRPQLK